MKKLPNGFGSVVKLSGNRTNPYMVRVTDGEPVVNHETGSITQNYKVVGYTDTRQKGIDLLYQYHYDPNFMRTRLTFKETYFNMYDEFVDHLGRSSKNGYDAAFDSLRPLHGEIFADIKMKQLQDAFDNCGKNYPTLRKIKVLLNQMYKWSIKYDLVDKDYSRYLEIAKHKNKNPNRKEVQIFNKKDIDILWEVSDTNEYYQVILILIYTGVRIQELLSLKKEDINLEEQYFQVLHSKTKAGIRRVPIADVILPFFKYWVNKSECEYFITRLDGQRMLYSNYLNAYWKPLIEPLGWIATPHHARHTCVTLLTEAMVEPTFIKLIVGHEGAMSLTERVYTHISNIPLLDSINKIYVPDFVMSN